MSGLHVGYFAEAFPTFVEREIAALRRHGVKVSVFAVFKDAASRREDALYPSPRKALAATAAQLFHPLSSARALSLARSLKSDARKLARCAAFAREARRLGVTQLHGSFAAWPAEHAALTAALTGLPYSFTGHAYDLFVENEGLAVKLTGAARVRVISKYNKRFLTDHCGADPEKVEVIHLGVPLDAAPKADRESKEFFEILSVGRLVEKKGFGTLLDACAAIMTEGVAARLRIVGDGPLRSMLEERARSLGARVAFLGGLSNAEVQKLIAASDVAALACLKDARGDMDGIPVFLMEAMAAGVPVVSTALSGIGELVESEKGGILVPPGDAGALARALGKIARDPALATRLGAAGREKIARDFEQERQSAALAEFFARVERPR